MPSLPIKNLSFLVILLVSLVSTSLYFVEKKSFETRTRAQEPISSTTKNYSVTYQNSKFIPEKITIKFGESVTWINKSTNKLEEAQNLRGKAWVRFYEFKNRILVIDDILTGAKDKWYKPEIIKKHIAYGYGITIHKSQGSTYNTVFVNGKDINKNINDIERKRLWYVALSRASTKVYINL